MWTPWGGGMYVAYIEIDNALQLGVLLRMFVCLQMVE